MAQLPIDADALIEMFESASAKQGEQVRLAVSRATLAALQGRELTLKNIRATLKAVSDAANVGLAKNLGVDTEALLDKAVAGMDDALLKAVEANRRALGALVDKGADMRDKQLKKALGDIEKFEDMLMDQVRKAAAGAGGALSGPWNQVLEKMQAGGTVSGAQASQTVEQLMDRMQSAVRESRQVGMRAAAALASSYTAMVSGVLIGMSDALQRPDSADEPASAPAPKPAAKGRKPAA
jgi:hypothetical protein